MPILFERIRSWLLPVIIGLLLILTALIVVFFITKCSSGPSDGTPAAVTSESDAAAVGTADDGTPLPPPDSDTENESVILPATPDAGKAYQDSLIFVGDSLTAHLVSRGVLSGGTATTQVWRTESNMFNLKPGATSQQIIYPGPGTATGSSMTVAEAAAHAKPRVLVITLGTDWGVAFLDEPDFKACYAELVRSVQKASPHTTVVLQSIFPVTAGCTVLTNGEIDKANEWVKAVAVDTGCRYLDTQSVLKDEAGCLKASYCNSADGIHLSTEAYQAILAYIRTHAVTN